MTATPKPKPEAAREAVVVTDPAAAAAQREVESESAARREGALRRADWQAHERRCRQHNRASLTAARGLLARLAGRPDVTDRLSALDRQRVENLSASVAADNVSSFGLLLVQRAVAPLMAQEPAP